MYLLPRHPQCFTFKIPYCITSVCDIGSILLNRKTLNLQLEEQTPAFKTANASLSTEWAPTGEQQIESKIAPEVLQQKFTFNS